MLTWWSLCDLKRGELESFWASGHLELLGWWCQLRKHRNNTSSHTSPCASLPSGCSPGSLIVSFYNKLVNVSKFLSHIQWTFLASIGPEEEGAWGPLINSWWIRKKHKAFLAWWKNPPAVQDHRRHELDPWVEWSLGRKWHPPLQYFGQDNPMNRNYRPPSMGHKRVGHDRMTKHEGQRRRWQSICVASEMGEAALWASDQRNLMRTPGTTELNMHTLLVLQSVAWCG